MWSRLRPSISLTGSLALALGLSVPDIAEARVLLVSDAGADLNMADALRADGHEVDVASGDFASGNAALRGDLSAYDAVVWSASGNGSGDYHTDGSVFANLAAFVERGGRVLVTGYDSVASPDDPLLIQFLGGGGSTDVPGPPGAVTSETNDLTTGVVDLRGVLPVPVSGDRDTLTGLGADTIEVVGTQGGGGAQWTLRRLGGGEIAYVSNGDSGTSATVSWTDPTSAYNGALRNFVAAANPWDRFSVADALPATGAPHPRRGRVSSIVEGDRPAVLVGPDRAWLPDAGASPIAVCGVSRCRPVLRVETCTAPRCPGSGSLVIATESIADVSELPGGRDAWYEELAAVARDPELAGLAPHFGVHPAPSSGSGPRFGLTSDPLRFELGAHGGVGMLVHSGVGVGMASVNLGVRWTPGMNEPLELLFGTTMGLDARVTLLPAVNGQRPEDFGVLLGLAPHASYALDREPVRLPPTWAWVVPEVGVALRPGRAEAVYVGWSLAGAVLFDEHAGLEARGGVLILDDWADGDAVEALVSVSLGLILR